MAAGDVCVHTAGRLSAPHKAPRAHDGDWRRNLSPPAHTPPLPAPGRPAPGGVRLQVNGCYLASPRPRRRATLFTGERHPLLRRMVTERFVAMLTFMPHRY